MDRGDEKEHFKRLFRVGAISWGDIQFVKFCPPPPVAEPLRRTLRVETMHTLNLRVSRGGGSGGQYFRFWHYVKLGVLLENNQYFSKRPTGPTPEVGPKVPQYFWEMNPISVKGDLTHSKILGFRVFNLQLAKYLLPLILFSHIFRGKLGSFPLKTLSFEYCLMSW